jgi:hypothetical protein
MNGCRHLRHEVLAVLVLLMGIEVRPADTPDAPPVSRRPLSWITEVLAAELPKYEPHPAAGPTELSTASQPAVERDGVLNLPTVTVRPVMKESPADYSFLTAKGRMDLALKTHPGLRVGNIFGLNNGIGLFMQMEEQEVSKKAVLLNRVQSSVIDSGPESMALLRLIKEAIVRPNNEALSGRSLP